MSDFAAIVLAGAHSARLGGADKPMLEVGGVTLLDRVLAGVAGATTIVVVGPRREVGRPVVWCEEQPPGGGPVAAFATGLPLVDSDRVVLLAADLPFVAGAVPTLLEALTGDVAVLVDGGGRANFLASAWNRVSALSRLADLGDLNGLPMRKLFHGLAAVEVPDRDGWSTDCDTWEAIAAARSVADGGRDG